jgi:Putative zinc-finger
VTCLEVREHLPEFAVGVLAEPDRTEVERHLRWCAGCRKEASELGSAAATVGFALPLAAVPKGLADRVVGRIRHAAGAPGSTRRLRTAASATIAALVAIGALGWGAVMAGRAERFEDRAAAAEERQAEALADFRDLVTQLVPEQEIPTQETFLTQLVPRQGGSGGGFALELVSETRIDFVIVMVNGLDPADVGALPYRVTLANEAGKILRVGKIQELDADGVADLIRQFDDRDLSGFTEVQVTDARGAAVLSGTVDQTPSSPSP